MTSNGADLRDALRSMSFDFPGGFWDNPPTPGPSPGITTDG
jgi:hypothetical protein